MIDGPLTLPTIERDHLPDGMRNSTDCPAARVIEFLEPERRRPFPAGIGTIGHVLGDVFLASRFGMPPQQIGNPDRFKWVHEGVEHEKEFPLVWKHGVSHIDLVVWGGQWAGCWELKTTNTPNPIPAAPNRRQVQRMIHLAELGGWEYPGPWRVVVIEKGNRGNVCGPWTIDLDQHTREGLQREDAAIDALLDRADTLDLDQDEELEDLCTCGQCHQTPKEQLAADVADYLDNHYLLAADETAFWRVETKEHRDHIIEMVADLDLGKYESNMFTLSIGEGNPTKGTRVFRITRKKGE